MRMALDHAGLSVSDLDASAVFYRQAFGFEPEFSFDLPHQIRGVMLKLGAGVRLELFERPGAVRGIQGSRPIEALATRGYGHFAFSARDIQPVFDQALCAGATAVVEPSLSPEPGVRFAFVADPEGNLVELVERR